MGIVTDGRPEVRQIRWHEWERLRSIRLEALNDTPDAYTETLPEAEAYPDSVWQVRATDGEVGNDQITMIAVDGHDTVGMAVGLLRPLMRSDVVPIVSVYVSGRARRSGIGFALMEGVEDWARSKDARGTSLWVVEDNTRAWRFYESLGYVATLDRQKIMVPPVRWETRMVKELSG